MADRVEVFDVTVPAGTPRATPTITAMTFRQGVPVRVQVVIPDGVAGLAGFQIGYQTQSVIPDDASRFIVGNAETWTEDLANLPTGGRWSLIAYNTDVYDHTFHVRWSINELRDPTPVTVLPQPVTFAEPIPETVSLDDVGIPPDLTGADEPVPLAADDVTP